MVINDLRIKRVAVLPSKTDTPLIVDSNAPLARPIAGELLQPVCWWNTKVFQGVGSIQHAKLSQRNLLDRLRQPAGALKLKYPTRFFAPEGPDHR
jgi:hypothetical protein